jgi:asparagine synthase (glutamine-hydrolysing)
MGLSFKLQQFLKGLEYTGLKRHQAWLGAFCPREQQKLFTKDATCELSGFDPLDGLNGLGQSAAMRDDVDALVGFYLRYYMAGHILVKVDMASMAHGLEVRSPFLDIQVAEYVNHLPSRYKLRGVKRKYLLKKMAEKKLPAEILDRSKKGFGIPLAKWLKKDLKPLMLDAFSESRIKAAGFFDPVEIRRLVDEHLSGRKDNRKQLWSLLCFEMWRERYARTAKDKIKSPTPVARPARRTGEALHA